MTENILTFVTISALLLIFYKLLKKTKRRNGEDSPYILIWWFSVFMFNFGLYFYALWPSQKDALLYLIAISVKSSLRTFTFDFYYNDVQNIAENSMFYSAAIIFCYFASILWTAVMAKKIFFPGITNGVKIWLNAKLPQIWIWNNYHYIIVGCEKSMRMLLLNLRKERVSTRSITIITGISVEKGTDSSTYFKEFIEEGYTVINGKADEAALEKAGIKNVKRKTRVIAITECDEQNLNVAEIITQKIFTYIFSEELKELKNKYKDNEDKRKQEELKFLDEMVKSVSNSTKFDEAQKNKQKILDCLKNINLEAHIMYSFIERTEHFAFAENAFGKVDFFNPYELRARSFFGEHPITTLIPRDFIDTSKARLKEKYNIKHIFVGFGKANYQMLKGSVLTCQLLNCDYNATVYDEKIRDNEPSVNQSMFMNHSSGLFDKISEDYDNEKYNIKFKRGNALTKNFYTEGKDCLIEEMKNDFTIIYVALGEDKLTVETACEIRQCLYKHDIKQDNVRIFAKVSEKSVFNNDLVINNPQNIPIKIECFGFNNSVFTEDNIINESLDKFAKNITNKNHEIPWEFLPETKRDINRQVAMAIRVKLNLLGLDLTEQKESKNIIKSKTYYETYYKDYKENGDNKISTIINLSKEVAELNNEEDKKQELKKKKDERSNYILDYEEKDSNNKICDTPRNNLARLEHLRWNTFHLIYGWTKMPESKVGAGNSDRQNKLTKQHACITTFEGLIDLRKLQATKMLEKNPGTSFEKAEAKADTIWYDYNLMDELPIRLEHSKTHFIQRLTENKT